MDTAYTPFIIYTGTVRGIPVRSTNRRASASPVAAAIPAPTAYIKVVAGKKARSWIAATKKLAIGRLPRTTGPLSDTAAIFMHVCMGAQNNVFENVGIAYIPNIDRSVSTPGRKRIEEQRQQQENQGGVEERGQEEERQLKQVSFLCPLPHSLRRNFGLRCSATGGPPAALPEAARKRPRKLGGSKAHIWQPSPAHPLRRRDNAAPACLRTAA